MENVLSASGQQLPNNHNHFVDASQVKIQVDSQRRYDSGQQRNLKIEIFETQTYFLLLNSIRTRATPSNLPTSILISLFILTTFFLSTLPLLSRLLYFSHFLPSTTFQNVCCCLPAHTFGRLALLMLSYEL